MKDPRYPIGRLLQLGPLGPQQRAAVFTRMAALPDAMSAAVRGLDETQLDTPYRQGGWTVRQVVHHVADSHVNAYARCKLTITEKVEPPIKAYDENAWALLADARGPIGASLLLLQGVHERLVACLRSLPQAAFARTAVHSENGRQTLDDFVAIYGWHGAHHVAHITTLREAKGW